MFVVRAEQAEESEPPAQHGFVSAKLVPGQLQKKDV